MSEEHGLPLTDITQVIVVHQYHLYRCLLFHNGSQFLQVHLQATITHKHTNGTVRTTEGSTDGSRNTESHGTQSTGSDDTTVLGILKVTGSHHLVLTHIGNQYRFMTSRFADCTYHLTHIQRSFLRIDFLLNHMVEFLLFIFTEAFYPFCMLVLAYQLCQFDQCLFAITQNSHIHLYILVDFGRVNIHVNNLCLLGISIQITSNTVIKTHTDSNQYITFIGLDIGT